MKRLDKKGEHHTLGKDLTEGRYINSILTYIKNNSSDRDAYVLQQANLGSLGTRSINSNDDFKGLEAEISRFASHEIPIIDCVRKKDKDIYKAPFLDKQGTTSFFEFPSSLFSLKTIFD